MKLPNPLPLGFRLCFCLWLCACASAPHKAAPHEAEPEWVRQKPPDTAETYYFRALASDAPSREEASAAADKLLRADVALTVFSSMSVFVGDYTMVDQSLSQEGDAAIERTEASSWTISDTELFSDVVLTGIKVETFAQEYSQGGRKRWRAYAFAPVSAAWVRSAGERYAGDYRQKRVRGEPPQVALALVFQGAAASEIDGAFRSDIRDLARGALSRGFAAQSLPLALGEYDGSGAAAEDGLITVIFRVAPYPRLPGYGCVCVLRYERAGAILVESTSSEVKDLRLDLLFREDLARRIKASRDFYVAVKRAIWIR